MYYNVSRPAAELLFILARLVRPADVVEVGTANGYSAVVLGAAVQPFGGRVATIERDGELVERARRNLLDAGLQDTVTVHPGSAYKVLKCLPGPFPFVFLDATKQEYGGYFERVRPKLAPGAVLVADNVISHETELRPFMKEVFARDEFTSVVLPLGMGLLVALYRAEAVSPLGRPMRAIQELMADAERRLAATALASRARVP